MEPGIESNPELTKDSSRFYNAGNTHDIKLIANTLNAAYIDSAGKSDYSSLYASSAGEEPVLNKHPVSKGTIPYVKGMGLKDALYLLESMDLKVAIRGSGKVRSQNPESGSALQKKETITITLD